MKIVKKKIIYGCEARGDENSSYLTRWETLSSDKFAIYLHKFHRSDDNSSLHDHPWNFITIPLWRGYNDCTYNGRDKLDNSIFNKQRCWPLIPVFRKATHIHFVELINNKPAWTLIIRFKYIRWWGFWRKGIFTIFHEYFDQNGC